MNILHIIPKIAILESIEVEEIELIDDACRRGIAQYENACLIVLDTFEFLGAGRDSLEFLDLLFYFLERGYRVLAGNVGLLIP